jgi:hypothetical protein
MIELVKDSFKENIGRHMNFQMFKLAAMYSQGKPEISNEPALPFCIKLCTASNGPR